MAEVEVNNSKPKENGNTSEEEEDKQKTDSNFECNICLDSAKDAVISMCGHLFCWACLYQWLETRASNQTCPVCKAAISKEKVIPLYGRGSLNQEDPREKVPKRPQGQRTEADPNQSFMPGFNLGEGEGLQFHFGIGSFPFGMFASFNNLGFGGGPGVNVPPRQLTPQEADEQLLSKVFMTIAILFLIWLILV